MYEPFAMWYGGKPSWFFYNQWGVRRGPYKTHFEAGNKAQLDSGGLNSRWWRS